MRCNVHAALTTLSLLVIFLCVLEVSARKKKNKDGGHGLRWKDSRKQEENELKSAYENENLKLDCAARGRPKPKVSWFRNGEKLRSSDNIKVRKHTLTFKSLNVKDKGKYKCVVQNEHGRLEFTYNVEVIVQIWPLEVEGPMNLTVLEGESVKFRCRVLNDPNATISWLKRGQEGDTDGSNSLEKKPEFLENTGPDPEVLMLSKVTVKDSGKYACLAGNLWGVKYNNAWLTVVPTGNSPSISLEPKTTPTTSTTTTTTTTSTTTTTTTTTTPPTTPSTPMRRPFFWTDRSVTERPRITYPPIYPWTPAPKTTRKPKRKNGRRKNKDKSRKKKNRNKTTTILPPWRNVNEEPTVDFDINAEPTDVFNPYNNDYKPTPEKEDEMVHRNRTALETNRNSKEGIGLWTIYTIVGAIAGVILLLGLIAITVALCCRRDSNGLYKSTPV